MCSLGVEILTHLTCNAQHNMAPHEWEGHAVSVTQKQSSNWIFINFSVILNYKIAKKESKFGNKLVNQCVIENYV